MLGEPLIASRTIPPPAEDLVTRPRLLERLREAPNSPVTLVSAPAGSGKTSLLAAWARGGLPPGPVAWVSLEGGDVSRDELWRLAAAGRHRAEEHDGGLEGFVAGVARGRRPTTLVLDDFHAVTDDQILADVARLIESAPPRLRLVILTRRDPPLRLGRLRLDGRIVDIRSNELAFTADEAGRLLARSAGALSGHDIEAVWRRTEGWAAGLRMAELTLRHHPHPAEFLRAFAGHESSLADYMVSEILELLPEPVRIFMLRTSLVEAVCGDLADAITQGSGGAAMLRRLTRENAMLAAVEGSPGWFRYHPLLRDLLRVELRYERGGEVAALAGRAAAWLAADGRLTAAVRCAIQAGDWGQVADVVADGWIELLLEGDVTPVRDLLGRIGGDTLGETPELAVAAAARHVADGEPALTEAALERAATQAAEVAPERRDTFRVALLVVTISHRLRHGPLELPADGAPGATPLGVRPDLEAMLLATRGALELGRGETHQAELDLEAALDGAERYGAPYVGALALSHLAVLDALRGSLPRAAERASAAIETIEARCWGQTAAAAAAYAVRAEAEYLRDELQLAEQSLELAATALRTAPHSALRAYVLSVRINLMAAAGRGDSALGALRFERSQLSAEPPPGIDGALVATEAQLLYDAGEHEQAVDLLETALAEDPSAEATTALARLRLAAGTPAEALALAASLSAAADGWAVVPTRVQALAVAALAGDRLDDHDGAADSLEHALRLAEPAGLRRPLTQLGAELRPILHRHIRRGTAHRTLVDDLLASLDRSSTGRRLAAEPSEELSDRELAVLRYLPTMMSNQDIGGELFISVNTVKTHLRQIYRKLDVRTRRTAVERARELHLLGPRAGASRG